jgi:hypothetical protein
LSRRNAFLNVPYGLSYCRLRIIEESKEYGACNVKEDNQHTAKDLEGR